MFEGTLPSDTYEVRAFHKAAELRRLKDLVSSEGTGTAVILTEQERTLKHWQLCPEKSVIDTNPATYLLWGQGTGGGNHHWSELAAARVGAIDVPLRGVGEQEGCGVVRDGVFRCGRVRFRIRMGRTTYWTEARGGEHRCLKEP